jgi:hypothetical protein
VAGLPAVRWTSAFADVPAAAADRALSYWEEVTGADRGRPVGERGEFVPLVPQQGDRYLWLQVVGRDTGGWHPDLHVPDPLQAAAAARAAGAVVVADTESLVTLSSPAGLPFCLVQENRSARRRPPPTRGRDGRRSQVDQLCIDIPSARFDEESEFWSELTGWPRRSADRPEFVRLGVPTELPLLVLLQRLGQEDGNGIRAHVDLSCDDRAAETARHESIGGRVVSTTSGWTTLLDPAGLPYCVTDREVD